MIHPVSGRLRPPRHPTLLFDNNGDDAWHVDRAVAPVLDIANPTPLGRRSHRLLLPVCTWCNTRSQQFAHRFLRSVHHRHRLSSLISTQRLCACVCVCVFTARAIVQCHIPSAYDFDGIVGCCCCCFVLVVLVCSRGGAFVVGSIFARKRGCGGGVQHHIVCSISATSASSTWGSRDQRWRPNVAIVTVTLPR